jgi:8-oxo-dGTP pyrophosphatase MutT (NUDIX family)
LPYREAGGGQVEVMLVTSRETRRWVLPKGWPMKGKKPHRAAEREAYEEAGLVGQISKDPIGAYSYDKRLRTGSSVPCEVAVFPLKVAAQREQWPEKKQRQTRWFTLTEAAEAVEEDGLRQLLCGFGQTHRCLSLGRAASAPAARLA